MKNNQDGGISRRSFAHRVSVGLAAMIASGPVIASDPIASKRVRLVRFRQTLIKTVRFEPLDSPMVSEIGSAKYIKGVCGVSVDQFSGGETKEFKSPFFRAGIHGGVYDPGRKEALNALVMVIKDSISKDARSRIVATARAANVTGMIFCSSEHESEMKNDYMRTHSQLDAEYRYHETDCEPLRFNVWPDFFDCTVSIPCETGYASRINPAWRDARNELMIGVNGIMLDLCVNAECYLDEYEFWNRGKMKGESKDWFRLRVNISRKWTRREGSSTIEIVDRSPVLLRYAKSAEDERERI